MRVNEIRVGDLVQLEWRPGVCKAGTVTAVKPSCNIPGGQAVEVEWREGDPRSRLWNEADELEILVPAK